MIGSLVAALNDMSFDIIGYTSVLVSAVATVGKRHNTRRKKGKGKEKKKEKKKEKERLLLLVLFFLFFIS